MNHVKSHVSSFMTAVSFLFLLTACVHSRNIVYFHDLEDTTGVHVQDSIRNFQALIEPGDILDIYVNSLNPQASAIFNLGNSAQSPSVAQGSGSGQGAALNTDATSGLIRGYKVEQDGTIDFPVLGKMTVAGLTTTTLRDSLKMRLNDYLKVPVVDVRFLNYKITVLGEVAKPATYVISSGKSTIMDLLGMAGDLTIYGRRDNIMVIREQGGKRTFARLDLTSSKVFDSPYYFLKQNDVVYVEPTRAKVVASDDKFVRTVSILGAVLGLVVSLVIVFKY